MIITKTFYDRTLPIFCSYFNSVTLLTVLFNGKGTALVKNITDVRPIVTVHSLLHYSGHAIATEYSTRIRTICGSEQFMGLPTGCEIVDHYIRSQLESDPSLVIAR